MAAFRFDTAVVLFHSALGALVSLALRDERYNYIALAPAIGGALLFLERRRIFSLPRRRAATGVPVILSGALVYVAGRLPGMAVHRLTVTVLSAVLLWFGGFVLCYGADAFRVASFPMLLLLFLVPVPAIFLDKTAEMLRVASASVSFLLFRLAGVPVLRNGFELTLPGAEIQIAQQCSGIRSSVSLLIATLLAGHVFLRSYSRQALLALYSVPVAILKNALRIVTISWLGVYVDRGFFYGSLHRYGGLVASFLAVATLVPLVWLLRKSETPLRTH